MPRIRRYAVPAAIALAIAAIALVVPSPVEVSAVPPVATFDTPGTYDWTVPDDVWAVTADVRGAAGHGYDEPGGAGARAVATISVTPGEELQIWVGGRGNCGSASPYGGGGGGGWGWGQIGGSGGGSSDVRQGGTDLDDRVVVAGGGGGGGSGTTDGSRAGGDAGAVGSPGGGDHGGAGATQSAGGIGGGGGPEQNGSYYYGGDGADGLEDTTNNGGGGGGGWFGGGGGYDGGGGGGGSSYVIPDATDVTITSGENTGNGSVTLSWTVGPPPTSSTTTTTSTTTSTTSITTTTTALSAPQVTLGPAGAPVTTVSTGSTVPLTSPGWQPGSTVTVVMYSSPIELGTFVAGSDGTVLASVTIPASAPVGRHTIVVSGTGANGTPQTAQLAIQVLADPSAGAAATPAPLALAC